MFKSKFHLKHTSQQAALAAGAVLFSLTLAACGSTSDNASTTATSAPTSATNSSTPASVTDNNAAATTATNTDDAPISMDDAYCKAKLSATELGDNPMGSMTACFGEIDNDTNAAITITEVTISGIDAPTATAELHEVVNGTMQQKQGGFPIPADSSKELQPGGDHIMIMNIPEALEPGTNVTLTFSDNGNPLFSATVPVREIAAGNESYHG